MCVCVWPGFPHLWGPDTISRSPREPRRSRRRRGGRWDVAWAPSYRAGPFAFPAVRVEPLLLVGEGFGLDGEHPPLLATQLLPLLPQQDADGSEGRKHPKSENRQILAKEPGSESFYQLLKSPVWKCGCSTAVGRQGQNILMPLTPTGKPTCCPSQGASACTPP